MSEGHLSEEHRGICRPTLVDDVRQSPSKSSDSVSPHGPQHFSGDMTVGRTSPVARPRSKTLIWLRSSQRRHLMIACLRFELTDAQDIMDDVE